MKWSHLPVQGGLYDQDPELLDRWRVIFSKRAEREAEEEAKRKSQQRNPTAKNRMSPSRSHY